MRWWKYEVSPPVNGRSVVEVPDGAVPISVGMENDVMVVWVQVLVHSPMMVRRSLVVVDTGSHPVEMVDPKFLGTVVSPGGIVWHVWDEGVVP